MKLTIQDWLLATVQSGGVDCFVDIHVSDINPTWLQKQHWLDGGLEALTLAQQIVAENQLNLVVVLTFSLEPTAPFPLKSFRQLAQWYDHSPPSLYLFSGNPIKWRPAGLSRLEALDASSLRANDEFLFAYDGEFKSDLAEPSRSVYIVG